MNEVMAEGPARGAPDWPEQQGPELGEGERRRRWVRVLAVVAVILGLTLTAAWLTRDRIAENVIGGQLRELGLEGTYRIDSIGPRRQVISNLVIGDPARPDLTAARVIVDIKPRLGFPAIGRITLVRPRLYGNWRDGRLSFGSLDKVLYDGPRTEPFRLPDLDVAIHDGRARLLGGPGPVGLKLDGRGRLRGGFAGTLAAVAPRLVGGGCAADGLSLYGRISVAAERPRLAGPFRLRALACADAGLRLSEFAAQIDGTADKDFEGGEAKARLAGGAMRIAAVRANGLNGTVNATVRAGGVTARYDLLARGLAHPQAAAATLAVRGTVRGRGGRNEAEGTLDGGGLRLGEGLADLLAGYERAGANSLAAPLLRQFRQALAREGLGSRLEAGYIVRQSPAGLTLVVPQGRLVGGSGDTLLALSRLQYASGAGAPRLAGNFSTGGRGLPRIAGRMEQARRGDTVVRMTMAEYRAGDARIALPQLTVAQTANGALGFSGLVRASGALPGGQAENLILPIEGNRTPGGVLSLWRRCQTVRFDRLTYANLTLARRSLLLCPGPGGAMVRSDSAGTRIGLGTPGLDLIGQLGSTPIRISSGPAGFALPGGLFARALDVTLGPAGTATRFRLADLKAQVGDGIAGTFAGTDIELYAVPLDLRGATGRWRLASGKLTVSDAAFRLGDRAQDDRFQPLEASGASLTLADNRIQAGAMLREPASAREIVAVQVIHDLAAGRGHADLSVPGILFDERLQPDTLSRRLLGVVANARGTVSGTGRIDWTPAGVTSTGRFGSEDLDFAAAFGPVKGASGTVEFSDLINLETRPDQRLKIASINPGIEVTDGEMRFQLRRGSQLAVQGGSWPFLGGTLTLRPVDMQLGVAETRRYVLDIAGLDAALFVQQLELANISATGTFDGSLPLVFDENGGRIEGGLLVSRDPGGSVAYVGALTYKDLSPIANFAFDALKSLNYQRMRIAMDGSLEGEIVTRVRFDGVKQGEGAKRNFITRRFANLPLQFVVNVRAPFYQLITSFKAMYDPAFVKDPRTIGLIDAQGRPLGVPVRTESSQAPRASGNTIQSPVSENKP